MSVPLDPNIRKIVVPVTVLVNIEHYELAYGETDTIDSYTAEQVREAAKFQVERAGFGTVETT